MTTTKLEIDARGVANLVLSRPEKRNALSAEMIADLTRQAKRIAKDSAIRVVILAAEGQTFCAGGDLLWMRDQMTADAATRRAEALALATMLKALNDLPKPVIARVHGDVFGGGLGLLSVSDVVIADANARFGLTETRLGLIPATIGPYVVARIGSANARRTFLSPRLFGAPEACSLGFVTSCVAPDALDAAIEEEVAPCLEAAPGAVAEAKALVRSLGPQIDDSAISLSVDALVARWESDEADEGTEAFFARRPPRWAID